MSKCCPRKYGTTGLLHCIGDRIDIDSERTYLQVNQLFVSWQSRQQQVIEMIRESVNTEGWIPCAMYTTLPNKLTQFK